MTPFDQSSIDIRPAGLDERRRLYLLARLAFGHVHGWSDRRALERLESDVVFTAWERGVPAGYVAVRPAPDAPVVEQLLVAEGHQGRGVGRRLLAYVEGYAIGQRASVLRIVVETENHPARRLYRRLGYVPVEDELYELVLPSRSGRA
jgi:GNAT superfamily N-acetyltransferase